MSAVASRIVNDVSCVSKINHESHFSWQAQQHFVMWQALYLVMSQCHAVSILVAGAAFGDVAVSLFVAGAAFGEI